MWEIEWPFRTFFPPLHSVHWTVGDDVWVCIMAGLLHCVVWQYTLFSQCLSLPRSVNGWWICIKMLGVTCNGLATLTPKDHWFLFLGKVVYSHNVSSPIQLYGCVCVKPIKTWQNAQQGGGREHFFKLMSESRLLMQSYLYQV